MMGSEEILRTVLAAVIGGSGVVGLLFYPMRVYIDKQIERRVLQNEFEIKRRQVNSELDECYRQCFFWIQFYITTGEAGENLEQAFQKLYTVEERKKAIESEILARTGGGQ